MVGRLVFHIGDRKTGSTSIQRALATGAGRSPAVSLAYPARAHHIALASALFRPGHREARAERWGALARRLARLEADLAVISAEGFESVPPAVLTAAIGEFLPDHAATARVIAYVRPHADRLLSSWTQQVKMGLRPGSLEDCHRRTLAGGRFLYADRFAAWAETFGERFTLRPMLRAELAGGDVVRDFYATLFAGAPFTLEPPAASNEALCLEDLAVVAELQRRLRPALDGSEARGVLGARLAQILQAGGRSSRTRPALHRSLAETVVVAYRADAAAVDARFFPAGVLTRALEEAPARAVETPQRLDLDALLTPAEARQLRAFAALLAALAARAPATLRQTLRRERLRALLT
jgi:hypothetical protein